MRHLMWALLLALALVAANAHAAVTPTASLPQTPQNAGVEIISGTAQCTAAGQPFTCCTGSGAATGCTTTAASTDAAPTWVAVYTGGANGSKVTGLYATTTDGTASHLVTCGINKGGATPWRAGGAAVTIAISSGFATGVPAVNLLAPANWPGLPRDSDGNPYIFLSSTSDKLECRYATALTSGKLLGLVAIGADF